MKKYLIKSDEGTWLDEVISYEKPNKFKPHNKDNILKKISLTTQSEWEYFLISDGNNYHLKEYKNKTLVKKITIDACQFAFLVEGFLIWQHEGHNIHHAEITSTVEVGKI
jgi:hypothetical protein